MTVSVAEAEWSVISDDDFITANVGLNTPTYRGSIFGEFRALQQYVMWIRSLLAPAYPNWQMRITYYEEGKYYEEQELTGHGWMIWISTYHLGDDRSVLARLDPYVNIWLDLHTANITAADPADMSLGYAANCDSTEIRQVDWEKVLDMLERVP